MSTLKQCDRCTSTSSYGDETWTKVQITDATNKAPTYIDLCSACHDDLTEFLAGNR